MINKNPHKEAFVWKKFLSRYGGGEEKSDEKMRCVNLVMENRENVLLTNSEQLD